MADDCATLARKLEDAKEELRKAQDRVEACSRELGNAERELKRAREIHDEKIIEHWTREVDKADRELEYAKGDSRQAEIVRNGYQKEYNRDC